MPVAYCVIELTFYEVFKNGDRKWLVSYADAALNGVLRTLYDYSPENGREAPWLSYSIHSSMTQVWCFFSTPSAS